jgi:hypothetical protein
VLQDTSDPTKTASDFVENKLDDAYKSNNVDSINQCVNIVASSINTANCTLAPDCMSLNRTLCSAVSHTCGPCLHGFIGILFVNILLSVIIILCKY